MHPESNKRKQRPKAPRLETKRVEIDALEPYPDNPRRGDLAAIAESLEANGQYRPIVVNERTGQVLAGNHTLEAAKRLGWKRIAATYVDVDEERARRIVLADNRTNDLAGYDAEALAELLGQLDGLDGTGYEPEDLDQLLDELEEEAQLAGPEDPPPLPPEPRTKPGEIYELGRHRLLCGDACDPDGYERLLGQERIDLLWTDPPYGVEYAGKTEAALQIKGDRVAGLDQLLAGAFAATDPHLKAGARLYVCHPSGELAATFIAAFKGQGWSARQGLVWAKDSLVVGHHDYHYRHESILYGHKPANGRIGRGGRCWYGDDAQASVLEVARPQASREHPTMKPVELIEIAIANSTTRSHLILDPFAGSGSTLIAAERLGRTARLIELDPRYCDVIVARFERATGKRAERKGAG
jgi:DNA modification methylase